MSSRGTYRSIHVVLIDGPDYQALPPNARLVLLTLKLNLGPTGIDVLYPAVLEDQTGLGADQVLVALDVLEHAGWIRRERNVVWIVEALRHEPSRTLTNPNHRKEVVAHLNGLPRLPIVNAFRRHYDLMPDAPPEGMGDGIGRASEGHSGAIPNHGNGNGNGKTTTTPAPAGADAEGGELSAPPEPAVVPAEPPTAAPPRRAKRRRASAEGDDGGALAAFPKGACDALYERWLEKIGGVAYGRLRKELAPLWTSPAYAAPDDATRLRLWRDAIGAYAAWSADDPFEARNRSLTRFTQNARMFWHAAGLDGERYLAWLDSARPGLRRVS